jgi:hypothetical protein
MDTTLMHFIATLQILHSIVPSFQDYLLFPVFAVRADIVDFHVGSADFNVSDQHFFPAKLAEYFFHFYLL